MRLQRAPARSIWTRKAPRTRNFRGLNNKQALSTKYTESKDQDDILPQQPTWSLHDLISPTPQSTTPTPTITPSELHHLLRLSALPLPKSPMEEQKMQKDLQSQLHFVRAIQKVDIPDDVEPLQSIRDETEEAMKEQEYTVEALREEFAKEEVVGKRGRIRRGRAKGEGMAKIEGKEEKWDPLKLAPRTVGRYIAVNTARD